MAAVPGFIFLFNIFYICEKYSFDVISPVIGSSQVDFFVIT